MARAKQDPAMLIFVVVGIMIVTVLDTLGVVSTEGGGTKTVLLGALYYGVGGAGGGLAAWAIFRRFKPWT